MPAKKRDKKYTCHIPKSDMKFIYHECANKGGIYRLTNKANGKIYIGSTKPFKVRFRRHFNLLKNNCHFNQHLQNAWNKYGQDMFEIEVIQVIEGDRKKRTKIEQKYLDSLIRENKWNICYNQAKKCLTEKTVWSYSPEKTKKKLSQSHKGHKHSEEAKKKIGEYNKGKSLSEEHRKKISTARKGRKFSDETRRKMSESAKKRAEREGKEILSARAKKVWTEKYRQYQSKINKGKKLSEEHKEKIKLAHLKRREESYAGQD